MCSFPTMKFNAAGGEAELVGLGAAVAPVVGVGFGPGFAVSPPPPPASREGPLSF